MSRRADSHSAHAQTGFFAPKRRLNPDLRRVAHDMMREGRFSGQSMAVLAGFQYQATFSHLLNADLVSATPLNVKRLQRVAEVIGYHGDIFVAEEVSA